MTARTCPGALATDRGDGAPRHTPGPWWFNGTHVRKTFDARTAEGRSSYCLAGVESDVVTYAPESAANGRLMAAAPELLSALQELMRFCENSCVVQAQDGREIVYPAFEAARTAVAKATRGAA